MCSSPCFAGQTGKPSPIRPPRRIKSRKRPNAYRPAKEGIQRPEPPAKMRLPADSTEPMVLLDDRGNPDISVDYNWMEEEENPPEVLCRTLHALPTSVDPKFDVKYDETKHGPYLKKHLKTDHLSPKVAARLTALVKKHWRVFNPDGLKLPVVGYECHIDTGDAKPIACKNVNYGERESIIMDRHIGVLQKMDHIEQTFLGEWLSRALLAPKPHQEGIYDLANYKWRFCVSYIRLNQVTRVITYPMPRCDNATAHQFGDAKLHWLLDCPQGYHQVSVDDESRYKLAFAGPHAIKWRWKVMPFGPVNGPPIFICLAHDWDHDCKELAKSKGVKIGADTNTKIIVDNINSHAMDHDTAFTFMECQFTTAALRRLSLSLPKSVFFPKRFEFVGVDIAEQGNFPARSKHQLLEAWPKPVNVRDVLSLIGFGMFYSRWIPYFEMKIKPLRHLTNDYELDQKIATIAWTTEHEDAWNFILQLILANPCLQRFDHCKRFYIRTNFCSHGFGVIGLQPTNTKASLLAMRREIAGGECEFMRDNAPGKPALRPICFASRRSKGYEKRLHLYLGEGFAGDWGMGKCHHYMWSSCST